ncbi:MAG: chromosomal replication initiator protein DnaA [Oscillospiraceae bacterium]|jgi:chromosomal replication initiator protein|nr:chromosomal replication initiator protein DnaA [Oscillospiraceae bacterium]MCI6929369.1 chromosomal replication initiator protein DnaA [Ruminococcus sp.]MDY3088124.1 chromosomal replication initiator protein DnaA [Oscillospiraceae bacterium]CDA19934.1 chromosomal replication initiator protein DnaA [Ruminococcus sp. CAG:488]HBL99781.1 chromosomal replication initiator protein DnaA [Oscillospiraceae bacterium]
MDSFAELWEMVKEECKNQVSESIYNVWFKDMELVSFDDNKVVIALSDFKRKIVESRFMDKLESSFKNVIGFDIQIILVDVEKAVPVKAEETEDALTDEDTFDSFIVGASNKFAYAAANAVANDPGGKYNPLFIHGNSGLGKTHLLNAIAHQVKLTHPEANIVYTRGESFTNELVKYIGQKSTEAFHDKYRNADILLVDDVQFIAGKDSTQEEFFHTFNALYQAGNQIVLTSDRPPKEIALLEDRLRNRFEWGLMADIQSPDLETRMAIIKRKAEVLNFDLPDDIVQYIAEKLKNNIRQLEGAVKKMQAFVTMQGMPVNIMTAQTAIKDIIVDNSPTPVTINKIVTEVARTYGADSADIYSKKQNAQTTEMRQMAMYIVREMTGLSTKLIGREFNRDHSTVVYSLDKFTKRYHEDSKLRSVVDNIIKNIRDGR